MNKPEYIFTLDGAFTNFDIEARINGAITIHDEFPGRTIHEFTLTDSVNNTYSGAYSLNFNNDCMVFDPSNIVQN